MYSAHLWLILCCHRLHDRLFIEAFTELRFIGFVLVRYAKEQSLQVKFVARHHRWACL